jgi:GT2 family glycosyltransferase/SAM-dependent methyltransferase
MPLSDPTTALNLGCGLTVAPGWINIDNSPNARLSKHPVLRWLLWKLRIVSDGHYRVKWPACIATHDLRRGLPYPDCFADYVYTSHCLEHLSNTDVQRIVRDLFRVLKPGGVVRIVVPDLALGARRYLERLQFNPADGSAAPDFLEWMQLGKPGRRDPHLWMYDAASLRKLLLDEGFTDVVVCGYRQSRVPDCDVLDRRPEDSVHVEGVKPAIDHLQPQSSPGPTVREGKLQESECNSVAGPVIGMNPLVTILIATRNRPAELLATLRQLRLQQYPRIELLVIDDASETPLAPLVRQEWPDAVVRRNPSNLGYIASRSLGMRLAGGDFILSVDDDSCPVDTNAVQIAVDRFGREPELGVIAFGIVEGESIPPALPVEPERYLYTFVGCAHMMRTAMCRAVGPYYDAYVYYAEESEYSLRVLDAGWRILLLPGLVIHHRASGIGRSHGRVLAYSYRNALWTVLLRMPLRRALVELPWKGFVYGVECLRRFHLWSGVWAICSCVAGLASVLHDRQPIAAETLRTYDLLRLRKYSSWQELLASGAPRWDERWRWVYTVWWNRRRARAFWDQRAGGLGASPLVRSAVARAGRERAADTR